MAKIMKNGQSVGKQLVNILCKALPQAPVTGFFTHCRGIYIPAEGKGKVVNFEWQHHFFRITEALKVHEYSFGYNCRNLEQNAMTKEIEEKIALVK